MLKSQGKTWFIPHHGVYHPSKPGKIWIVFDCSADYDGVSVNKRLLSGPDLTNQIVGILVKFREDYMAIMADIAAMFYQVFVANQHRSLLSFLWWENGDIKEQPQGYHMVHVFGGTSSPSCSNYALQSAAEDNEVKYDPKVAETLTKWLSVRFRTKWFWVRVQLQSLHLQILRLLRARSFLTFRQL